MGAHKLMFTYAGALGGVLFLVSTEPCNFSFVTLGLGLLGFAIPTALFIALSMGMPDAKNKQPIRIFCGISLVFSLISGSIGVALLFWTLSPIFSIAFPTTSIAAITLIVALDKTST